MSKKKVLIVTQEMQPYTDMSNISDTVRQLAPFLQDNDMEIRVLMPRYGTINERRHRLHEVVRLSGMNIIVDDDDYPLIIKVASLPEARMQIYFLDNDDFFKRKAIFEDKEGKPFEDNVDRMVFFCKGVVETVKKFGWAPDIVHCHGWLTSLVPLYLQTTYRNEPLFQNAKIVYSIYEENGAEQQLADTFVTKASINNLSAEHLHFYANGSGITVHQGAIHYADATVIGTEKVSSKVADALTTSKKPVLRAQGADALAAHLDFYQSLLVEEVEN